MIDLIMVPFNPYLLSENIHSISFVLHKSYYTICLKLQVTSISPTAPSQYHTSSSFLLLITISHGTSCVLNHSIKAFRLSIMTSFFSASNTSINNTSCTADVARATHSHTLQCPLQRNSINEHGEILTSNMHLIYNYFVELRVITQHYCY